MEASWFTYEWLGHLSFVLIAAAYLVRDILHLRMLAICAALLAAVYATFLPEGGSPLIIWNLIFASINLGQILLIYREKMGVDLDDQEKEMYEILFKPLMAPVQFMKLLRIAQWKEAEPGEVLASEGEKLDTLVLIYSGRARVLIKGEERVKLQDGAFVGEMSFTTDRAASATVVVSEPSRLLIWSQDELRGFLSRNPSIRTAFHTLLGTDMAAKLATR